ncbi:DinB family protein, partial [Alphaproteobacteria bacterium]|nr:DinB family protein [Alphaproteobacteria bacterium]
KFESINILEDPRGFKDLEKFGLRMVPIVIKGEKWANGAVFRDVAKVVDFSYNEHEKLDPNILFSKIIKINEISNSFLKQIPVSKLDIILPGRPRSYRQLLYHIFNIPEVFLNYFQNETPYTYEALLSILPDRMKDKSDLYDYAKDIKLKFESWWSNEGINFDFEKPANVYYGKVSFHEVLERTAWHSGQHCRQVELLLKEKLNITPKFALNESLFSGLPMPSNIWDNERSFSENSYDGQVKEDLSIKE